MQDGELVSCSLRYLDVVTLIRKVKPVCKKWNNLGIRCIDQKSDGSKANFQCNSDLRNGIQPYAAVSFSVAGKLGVNIALSPIDVEEIARLYGYPVDKWDTSRIHNAMVE